MKRKIGSSLIIVGLIVLGVLGYEYFGDKEMEGGIWGYSKSYKTLEGIKKEADLVVRVHVPLYYDIREIGENGMTTKQAFYEVAIDEVFIDNTGHDFDEESEIMINQVIGYKDRETGDYKVEKGMRPMKSGDYLLFLNKVKHPTEGKVYYVSNSPRHLYRWRGNKTFRNVVSDELMEIRYSDLPAAQ